MATKYRVQEVVWRLHLLKAGGHLCAYGPLKMREFRTEAEARAALTQGDFVYANPPQSYLQILEISSTPGVPFSDRIRVIYEQEGPRLTQRDCKIFKLPGEK